jgi:hypothetical protein
MEGAMNAIDHIATERRGHELDQRPDHEGKNRPRPPVTSRLHPRIYLAVILLAAWFVLAVWGFVGTGITDYLLVIISGFIGVVVALMLILSRVGRAPGAPNAAQQPSFHDWATGDFATSQERLRGTQAATLILLPLAAAAIGMTAFAIAYHIAEHMA